MAEEYSDYSVFDILINELFRIWYPNYSQLREWGEKVKVKVGVSCERRADTAVHLGIIWLFRIWYSDYSVYSDYSDYSDLRESAE